MFPIWRGRLISRHICGGGLDPRGPRFFPGDNERAGDVEHGVSRGLRCLLTRAPNNPLPDLASVKKMLEKDLRSLLYNCRGTIPSATDLLLFRAEGTFYFDKQTLSRLRCPLLAPPLLSPSRTIESIEETVDFIGWANKILAMIPEKRYLYHVNSSPVEIKMFSCAPPSPKEEVVLFFLSTSESFVPCTWPCVCVGILSDFSRANIVTY